MRAGFALGEIAKELFMARRLMEKTVHKTYGKVFENLFYSTDELIKNLDLKVGDGKHLLNLRTLKASLTIAEIVRILGYAAIIDSSATIRNVADSVNHFRSSTKTADWDSDTKNFLLTKVCPHDLMKFWIKDPRKVKPIKCDCSSSNTGSLILSPYYTYPSSYEAQYDARLRQKREKSHQEK